MQGVSVVVPTYNEADNLPFLVPRIAAALASIPRGGEGQRERERERD